MDGIDELALACKELNLVSFAEKYKSISKQCEDEKLSFENFLKKLVNLELEERHHRKIKRLLKNAKIPVVKDINNFLIDRLPDINKSKIEQLSKGDFIDRGNNLLIFGNPGTGKTHLSIALTREWCNAGRKVLFMTAAEIINELLKAKKSTAVNEYIHKINKYEVLILDDISYIPCERHESDLLFNLLSSRYERKSIVITSNLPFAKWDMIFKDKMTTSAAVDRLVHHSIILKLNAESYRKEEAQNHNNFVKK